MHRPSLSVCQEPRDQRRALGASHRQTGLSGAGRLHVAELRDLLPCCSDLKLVLPKTRAASPSAGQQLFLTGNSDKPGQDPTAFPDTGSIHVVLHLLNINSVTWWLCRDSLPLRKTRVNMTKKKGKGSIPFLFIDAFLATEVNCHVSSEV